MTHEHHGHRDWDDAAGWSQEILREPALVPATEALLDAVRIRPGERLLDLACGLGQTTAAATGRGVDALGIDLSANRIAAARDRFPAARFEVADASRPPAGPWDAVVCRFGVHHLSETWAQAVHAVLVPGGRLAIAEWPPRDAQDRENGMRPAAHWVATLEQAGLDDVQVRSVATQVAALAAEPGPLEDRAVLIICGRKGSA